MGGFEAIVVGTASPIVTDVGPVASEIASRMVLVAELFPVRGQIGSAVFGGSGYRKPLQGRVGSHLVVFPISAAARTTALRTAAYGSPSMNTRSSSFL